MKKKQGGQVIDLTGERFGRWIVLEGNKPLMALVRCACGTTKTTWKRGLITGNSKSCGCYMIEQMTTHGMSVRKDKKQPSLYIRWWSMKQRCFNKKHKQYKHYGGRGITVCKRWLKFSNFKTDMEKGFNPELRLERLDNNKGYSKENCEWVSNNQQQNNKRNNVKITSKGRTQTVAEWAKETGLEYRTLYGRIKRGVDPDRALGKSLSH